MSRTVSYIVLRVVSFLLFITLTAGGGYMVYKAGVAQGISQAPAVATAISQAAESGQVAPVAPMYGYGHGYAPGYPMYGHHFGFFPFGSICGSIFFLFIFFGFMKMIFFRGMCWGHHGHHWRGMKPEGGEKETPEGKE